MRGGKFLITLDRGAYWQCAYVIAKGALERFRLQGLSPFREPLVGGARFLRARGVDVRAWTEGK